MNVYNTFNGTLCREIHERVHEDMYKRNRFQFPTNAEIRDNKLRSRAEQHAANIVSLLGNFDHAIPQRIGQVNNISPISNEYRHVREGDIDEETNNPKMWLRMDFDSKTWLGPKLSTFSYVNRKLHVRAFVTSLRVTNSLLSNADTYDGHIRHHQHHHHNFSFQQLAEATTNAALKIFYTKSLKTSLSQKQIEMCLPARNVQQLCRIIDNWGQIRSKLTYHWKLHASTERHQKKYLRSRRFRLCNR
uniref:Uncharacterized protein n=1 Tax=Glossina pallidipes TaxID=7398 RepID=A0A1B0AH34_GLOPL